MFLWILLKAELAQLVRWMALNQEVPGLSLAMAISAKSACGGGQFTLPKVVLDNNYLLSLDYEYANGVLEYVEHS